MDVQEQLPLQKGSTMRRMLLPTLFLTFMLAEHALAAGLESGFFNPYTTTGVRIAPETISPALRKWYLPQTLYDLYGWKNWEYSNYAKDNYQRYTDLELQGDRFYDIYGNFITRGWQVYNWTQEHPAEFGSGISKSIEFGSWFDRILISSASRGQFAMSLTIGEMLRTTLTPMTFSKPLFDGVQWDMSWDKYNVTFLASRASAPANVDRNRGVPPSTRTTFTNLLGFRGTAQVGDFVNVGATYVNAGHWSSSLDANNNSLKGVLSGRLNTGNVQRLLVRLSDDSPADGVGGAVLFLERVYIDGIQHPEIRPLVDGGVRRGGRLEANGGNVITLIYDVERDFLPGPDDAITDFREIGKIEIELVLANDYAIDITSNLQTNDTGEPVFLPIETARGNIQDGSNQRVVRFTYGIPSANEIAGLTLDVTDLFGGLNIRAEYDVNRRFSRFPNQNVTKDQALGKKTADAYFATASHTVYPWFGYGEVFSMDPEYNTSMFIPDQRGFVDYENESLYLFEMVDDNDDQDRFPDWTRRFTGGGSSNTAAALRTGDLAVFPGYDENNDLESDFNQNDNGQPDYIEPFIRYNVDPLEFLYGSDMNNNTVIDRFENDREADYPYKRDHRGYNVYGGIEIQPGSRLMLGRMRERLLSDDRRSKSTYGMLTLRDEMPKHDLRWQFYNNLRSVKDDIAEDVIVWVQPSFSTGGMQDFADPLIAQDVLINTMYLDTRLGKFSNLNLETKLKHEFYHQKTKRVGIQDETLLAMINKADYVFQAGPQLVLMPKWKQLYMRRTPTDRDGLKINELSNIGFLVAQYDLLPTLRLESGFEYEIFRNMRTRPDPLPAGYREDFEQIVLATQFSNRSHYLGYKLRSIVGGRWEKRNFKEESETNLIIFMTVFAGIG